MKILFLIVLFAFLNFHIDPVYPQVFKAQVIEVLDGDTIVVKHKNEKIKVNLLNIDAPEICQNFGKKSRNLLFKLLHKKSIRLNFNGNFISDKLDALITFRKTNINLHMVARGLAWVGRYTVDQDYLDIQKEARLSMLNIWEEVNPIPPWVFRTIYGSCKINSASNDGNGGNGGSGSVSCGSKKFCDEMSSCGEAEVYLQSCGLSRLDGDGDGIPCETICQ